MPRNSTATRTRKARRTKRPNSSRRSTSASRPTGAASATDAAEAGTAAAGSATAASAASGPAGTAAAGPAGARAAAGAPQRGRPGTARGSAGSGGAESPAGLPARPVPGPEPAAPLAGEPEGARRAAARALGALQPTVRAGREPRAAASHPATEPAALGAVPVPAALRRRTPAAGAGGRQLAVLRLRPRPVFLLGSDLPIFVRGRSYSTNQYGADYVRLAVNNGYEEGFYAGQADREDRWTRGSYRDSYGYQDANYGYNGRYIDQPQYNHYFREGFRRGLRGRLQQQVAVRPEQRQRPSVAGHRDDLDRELPLHPIGVTHGRARSLRRPCAGRRHRGRHGTDPSVRRLQIENGQRAVGHARHRRWNAAAETPAEPLVEAYRPRIRRHPDDPIPGGGGERDAWRTRASPMPCR